MLSWDQQEGSDAPWVLVWQYGRDDSLGGEFIQVCIKPCFLLWAELHGLGDNRALVLQIQAIVELGVPDETYVCLLGGEVIFARDQFF